MQSSASFSSITSGSTAHYAPSSSSTSSSMLNPSLASSDSINRLISQGPDPNSIETFKENLRVVFEEVQRLRLLSRKVLANTREAYSRQTSPYQAEADLATLKQSLHHLTTLLRQSGVGALPILPQDAITPLPTEDELIHTTTLSVKALYDQLKRKQESAGIVAGLLTLPSGDHGQVGPR